MPLAYSQNAAHLLHVIPRPCQLGVTHILTAARLLAKASIYRQEDASGFWQVHVKDSH